MSQYGSPPPPDPPDDGRTRIPGSGPPADPTPTTEWDRPTRQADQPGGSWDEAPAPGGAPAPWQQPPPYADPYGEEPRTRATEQGQAAPYASGPYEQPAQQPQQSPQPQQGWGGGAQGPPGGQGWSGSGGQSGQSGQGGQGGGPVPSRSEAKGFLGALFDFSFTTFVTPMIVKFVYLLAVVALGLGFLLFLVAAIVTGDALVIVGTLLLGPIAVVIYLCFIRMTLELYLAITRMSQDVHRRLPDQS